MTRQTQLLYQNDDGDLPQDPNIYHGYIFDQKNAVFGANKIGEVFIFFGGPQVVVVQNPEFLGFYPN